MYMSSFIFVAIAIGIFTNNAFALLAPSAVQPCSEWDKEPVNIVGTEKQGNSPSQLSSPYQIALDDSGKLYIYDTGNGRIQIVDQGVVSTWRHSKERLSGHCLFIDDRGTLYIENGHGKPILRWTSGNNFAEETKCRSSVCANMFVDSTTNDIYIADNYNHHVIKCTSDGKHSVVAGKTQSQGTSTSQLDHPQGIFVDEETKDIFIADTMNDRIVKWARHAKEGIIIIHNISLPINLIRDNNNFLYVTDRSHRIARLDPFTQEVTTIIGDSRRSSSSYLDTPTSLVFDQFGNIFVSDQGNHRIRKFPINNIRCPKKPDAISSPTSIITNYTLGVGTKGGRESIFDTKLIQEIHIMRNELESLRTHLESQNQCKAGLKDASNEFAQPRVRWCPWKSLTCVRKFLRRGQGTISITQHRPLPFELILSDELLLEDSHHTLKWVVNSDRVTISAGTRLLKETINSKDTLHVSESGSHTYWLSVHSFDLSIKYGQGEVRDLLTILKAQVNESERANLAQLQYFHLILNKTTDLESIVDFRDKIDIFIGMEPVVYDLPLFVVPRPPAGEPKHITHGKFLLPTRLPLANQQLYQDITDWELNDVDFPNFVAAIERSVEEDDGWCYKILKEKATIFGQANAKASYLRITMGHHQGLSPGIPYVLEIWPPYHYSPIHKHSNSYGLIRVLHGKLSVKLYASLNVHHQDAFIESLLEPGNVTWMSPGFNQIHKVMNPTDKVSITIQAYQYGDTDVDHYEYFDYIKNNGKEIGNFFPRRDEDFNVFKRIIKKEWNQHNFG